MKASTIGAVVALTAFGTISQAAPTSDGYDPLALDHFIAQSLAAGQSVATVPSAVDLMADTAPTVVAQQTQRFDSEGYLIGPDGQRIKPKLTLRWRVGVFR